MDQFFIHEKELHTPFRQQTEIPVEEKEKKNSREGNQGNKNSKTNERKDGKQSQAEYDNQGLE